VHASEPRKPEAQPITAVPPAFAGSFDLPTRQSGAFVFLQHTTVSSLGERALISRITSRLAMPPWVVVGPGDDAAVIKTERGAFDVLTTDAQVDGIHFDLRFVPPDAVGHRALAVNLSDLAAMGAEPRAALVSLLLPDELAVGTVDGILDGLLSLAARYRVALVGGNITRTTGPLALDVTATGSVRPRRVLMRSGAKPGDDVYVTGTLGSAAAGLEVLKAVGDAAGSHMAAVERYLRPEPRVRLGMLLGRNRAASSCMDLSDGLADAARQVAEASGVGVTIEAATLPIADDVRAWHLNAGHDVVQYAATGGDDYELLFTSRPSQRGRLRGVRRQGGNVPITRIGVVTKGRDVLIRDESGMREMPRGYEHFRTMNNEQRTMNDEPNLKSSFINHQ
jgi:thiamine-monophosphate kinase